MGEDGIRRARAEIEAILGEGARRHRRNVRIARAVEWACYAGAVIALLCALYLSLT